MARPGLRANWKALSLVQGRALPQRVLWSLSREAWCFLSKMPPRVGGCGGGEKQGGGHFFLGSYRYQRLLHASMSSAP